MTQPTVGQAIEAATQRLQRAGVPDAARDARRLMQEAMETIVPGHHDVLPIGASRRFEAMIAAREERQPVSHILGYREFWGRKFIVDSDVLDPRPETECLIEVALREPFKRVLDLGTGSGCILWTLLAERPDATGIGTDISADAIDTAADNPIGDTFSDRGRLLVSDWYDAIDGTFDLIVSNPPYISVQEMGDLAPEVALHEPEMALTDGGDGLSCYRAIIAGAPAFLSDGGRLIVEIGPTQGSAVRTMMQQAGLVDIRTILDLDGRDRVIAARK